MRRLLFPLAALAIVASACGGTAETVEVAADTDTPATDEIALEPAESAEEQVADPVEEQPTEQVEEEPEVEPMRSGREAILANHSEGKPYVLWYWGAN